MQLLKKRKINTASRAYFLDGSDEETEPEIEPQLLSLLSSQTSTPLYQEGAISNAAPREDTDQSEVCRSSQQEREELSSEGVKPVADIEEALQGVEATGSLSILSESQIDIQREMDVLTSSADLENGKTSPAPEPVPETADSMTAGRTQTEIAKWNIDPSLVVVNNDDFGTVIDQLSLSDQENEGDSMKEETKVVSHSEPGTEAQGHSVVAPAKTKMKLLIRSSRKYAPTKRVSKTNNLSGSGQRRKIDKVDVSKPRRRKRKEDKVCPPVLLSVESASESNETSAPSKKGHKADADKNLKIDRSVKAEENQAVVKRPKARPRKSNTDMKDPSSGNAEPNLSLAANEKKPKGRPRRKKHEENNLQSDGNEDEKLALGEKKAKGRPRRKKQMETEPLNDCSEDEALAISEKKAKGRSRKHKHEKKEPTNDCSEDEAIVISEKKPKGRRRNNKGKEDRPLNSCSESVTTSETKAKGRPRKRKREEGELPNDSSEPVVKKSRRPRKSKSEDKPPRECRELKLSPTFIDYEHQVSEDSGYPSSSVNSRSPTDCVLMSPINIKNTADFLQEDSFQETSNPILRDSNFGISKPETDTGSDIDTSQGLDISQGEADVEYSSLLHGMQPGFVGSIGVEPSAASNVLYDLDLLLSQDPTIFNFDSNPNIKLESSSEVDEILRSPSVSSCIRDLQRSGALPCGDSPQPDQESHTGQPPNSIATATPVSIPPSDESSQLVSDSHTAEPSSESCQLSSDAKVSGDNDTSCAESTSTQKGATVNNCQRRRKPALPILPPSMQTKSGRRLKRSWKLCSDDTDLEMALKLSAEDACKSATPERSITNTKEKSNYDECEHNLDASHPELSSTNAPLSALTGKTCEQAIENVSAKGDSAAASGIEKSVTGLSLSTDQGTWEPKDGNLLTGNTLRNKGDDKGTSQRVITTYVKPRTTELKAPLRTVKVKLKRQCVKALCPSYSHGLGQDNDGPPSSKAPPAVGNDMQEPLPGTSAVHSSLKRNVDRDYEEQSTTAKELCSIGAVVPHTSLEEESKREGTLSKEEKEIFTPNGLIHSGKKLSLFSKQETSDGGVSGGGIFSNRMGSIFAGSHQTQAVTSSGNYIIPHATNAETMNLKSQPNSGSSGELHNCITPSAAYKRKSNLPHSNSLSMSLDTVLKQMGEVKDNSSIAKTCRVSEFKFSLSNSRKTQNFPEVGGVDTASSFEKGGIALGGIQYNSPSAYRASLASSAISDLILAPLNVGETLDEELKGESLFDSNTKDDCRATESLLATCKEAQELDGVTRTETEKDASQLTVDEQAEAFDGKSKQADVPPPAQNLDDVENPLCESVGRIESVMPFKEPKSPPVIRKIHLSGMETEGEELMEEDCISLFPREDDDLLGGDVDEEPLAKFYAQCPKLTKSTGTGVANQTSIKRRPLESHRGYSPPPLDDGGFESSFEKSPAVVPFKSQQVSWWVADQQKRKAVPAQASRLIPSSTGRAPLIHLTLRGRGSLNPWGPSSGGNSHGVPHGNAAHVQENGSASPGPFVASNLPQG